MRKIYLYMTTTLDGFIAGPDGELDWMLGAPDKALNDDIVALLRAADGGLLGYPVAQGMIPYWEGVAADPSASPGGRAIADADAVNRLHRIIISSQPAELPWRNAELVVARTAQRFARLGLIDEYVLHVHPSRSAPASRCSPRRPPETGERQDLRLRGNADPVPPAQPAAEPLPASA
jgi:dihydrofolate reductase